MQKVLTKSLSILTIFMLVGTMLLPTLSYASSEIQEAKTTEENVSLNANINGKKEAALSVSEGGKLELDLAVKNTGYLKDIKVTLENANYEIKASEEDENLEKVKSVEGNVVELNEVNAGEEHKISLPIAFAKENEKTAEDFKKESKVVFNAVYKNAQGKEKKIRKEIALNLEWNVDAKLEVSQKLTRYLKYGKNTMVTVEITDGIQENIMPVVNKEISITTPKINKRNPDRVIVNAEKVESYYDKGMLTITKKNEANEEKKVSTNSKDTYSVTYIYETQGNESQIATSASEKATTIKLDTIDAKSDDTFDASEETGSIVAVSMEGTPKINKGYMYTNTLKDEKQTTSYQERYNIDIGLSDLVDTIKLEQTAATVKADENVIADVTSNIITKKIIAENFTDILGEDGNIKVYAVDGTELGNINKDNTSLEISNAQIRIETTKPVKEGTLKLLVEKEIATDISLTLDQLKEVKALSENLVIKGYKSNTEISKEEKTINTTLEAPTSKASLSVSQKALSTVVENKDIVFNVVLNKKEISDALYQNPKITITLPEEVTGIQVTDARVLYENEIKAGKIETGKNFITVSLEGTQTKYLEDAISNGTLVRIVANVSLYNLAPSNESPISLTYSNELTGEEHILNGAINVVAPTGFVTTNTIEVDEKSETALESDKKEIEVSTGAEKKTATISGIIVNNLGENAGNATIIGRLPFKGNKTLAGTDLESNVDLKLTSAIAVEGQESYKVYYSEDGEANINSNKWTEQATASAKSFKIVFENPIATGTLAKFKYNVEIPENLSMGTVAKTCYGVYYSNDAVEGVKTNLVQSKTVGIATPGMPNINAEIETVDSNDGHVINNEGNVTEGEYVTYKVKITNNGTKDAKNVRVEAVLPERVDIIRLTDDNMEAQAFYAIGSEEDKIQNLGSIQPEETKYAVFEVRMPSLINIDGEEDSNKYKALFNITADNETSITTVESTVKNTEGNITVKLTANNKKLIQKDETINYLIDVRNITGIDKNGVTVKVQLPEGVEYVESEEKADYNKKANTITFNIGSISGIEVRQIYFTAKCTADTQRELQTTAIATVDKQEVKSNAIVFNSTVIENNVTAGQKSSIANGNMIDKDTVELYIDIYNNSNASQVVKVDDDVPAELQVLSYKAVVDGEVQKEGKRINAISASLNLNAGQSGRITITAKPNAVIEGESKQIENKPYISTNNGNEIKVNSTNITIKGTKVVQKSNEDSSNRVYSIQGTVWFDENSNGKKEENENKLSGIKVTLYNANTKSIVTDEKGNSIVSTTNENGNYEFNNLPKGNYNVVAYYDKESYDVGAYQMQDVSDSENSDFVESILGEDKVAATNTLEVKESNIYNVDLALSNRNIFDLSLENTISKVTVTNSKTNNTKTYNFNSNLAKFEIEGKELRNSDAFNSNTVLVEYKITVRNNGHIAGYAKSIADYIPKGLEFNSELNKEWYIGKDGYAHTTSLANTIINPGETKEITLVLTKKITEDNIGTVRNTAEIEKTYNEQGLADINSEAGNMQTGENDMSSSDLIIATSAGRQMLQVTGITIAIIAIIAIAVYEIKKQVINKVEI